MCCYYMYSWRPSHQAAAHQRVPRLPAVAGCLLDGAGLPGQQDPDSNVLVQVSCVRKRHLQILNSVRARDRVVNDGWYFGD
jgi:hypothetical protein